jgi:hypothetical protein
MQISEAAQKPDFPSSVSSRVCQTCVRARSSGCHGRALLATPTKFVLLSIVVVPLASEGRFMSVAAPPVVSASAIALPPWIVCPRAQRSGRTTILEALRAVCAASTGPLILDRTRFSSDCGCRQDRETRALAND